MEEIKCSCGGTFQYLGPEFLRTGNIQFLVDKDVEEKCIPGELYVCDRCRCLRFCANAIWISERKAWWEWSGNSSGSRPIFRPVFRLSCGISQHTATRSWRRSPPAAPCSPGMTRWPKPPPGICWRSGRQIPTPPLGRRNTSSRSPAPAGPDGKTPSPPGSGNILFCDRQKIPGTSWLQEFFTERTGPGQMPGALMRSIYLYSSTRRVRCS